MSGPRVTDPYAAVEADLPAWLRPYCDAAPLRRLTDIGMNCGCEYTAFARFRGIPRYSRFMHSLGTARIVWRHTGDRAQTLAALFHDIAAPVFAHTIDFMLGDHLKQEATESGTARIIREDGTISALLEADGIPADAVEDYHRYPVADNETPRLCADRLEYTLGNLWCYGLRGPETIRRYDASVTAGVNGDGLPELCFSDADTALSFARDALAASRIYVADEDRYAMQRLSEVMKDAMDRGVLCMEDLYTTETRVIGLLRSDPESRERWEAFRRLSRMTSDPDEAPAADRRVIRAKRRYIDPLITGRGRVSRVFPAYARELGEFLRQDQEKWICGVEKSINRTDE